MAEPPRKRSRLFSASSVDSSDCSSKEPFVASKLSRKRNFLLSWMKIYSWIITEGSGDDMVVICKQCQKAGLSNDYAKGKKCPGKGWKREYLQRHAESDDHVKHAVATVRTAQHAQASNMFVPMSSAVEKQTIGLMKNILFLAKNGLPII